MKTRRSLFLAGAALLTTSSPLHADVIYWDGSANTNWGTTGNWSTSGTAATPDPATVPGASDIATFSTTGGTYPRTVNLDESRSVSGISTENQTGLTTLRGTGVTPLTLTIGSAGINHLRGGLTIGSTGDDKVSIRLLGSQTWASRTAGSGTLQALVILNDVSGANAGLNVLTLDGINTGTQIRGAISDGLGTVGITKTGSGIWELQGTNTYSGATQVDQGILRLANAVAAPPSSVFTVANNATLSLKTANSGGTSGFSSIQINDFLASPNLVFTSTAARLALDTSNGAFNHTGNLTGAFTLQKLGNNVLTLSGTNTHSGPTLITEGGIAFGSDSAISANSAITVGADTYLTVTSAVSQTAINNLLASATFESNATFGYDTTPGNLTLNNVITGSNGLAKTGANTLTLEGTQSNTYTGLTHLAGGTLSLGKTGGATAITGGLRISTGTVTLAQNEQIADTADVNLLGGTLNFSAKDETIASLSLSGGASVVTGAGGTMSVGNITRAGNTSKITVNSGAKLIAANVTLGGDKIAIDGSGGGNILIGGGNTSRVTELQITGNLTMTNQTIQVNTATSGQKGSRVTLAGNFTGNGANEIAVSGTINTLAELSLGPDSHTFNINSSGSGSSLVAGNTLIGLNVAGTGDIVKTGSGALSLSGNNTYTGVTRANAGSIRVLHNNALGSTAGGTVTNGGAIHLENNVTVTGEAITITGLSAGSSNNAGLVNISGNNVWTGAVTMDVSNGQNARINMTDGTLDLRGNVVIDSGASTSTSIGLVFTGNGGSGTISGNISGIGAGQTLIKNGTSTLTLTGNNTYTGVTRVDDGILNVSSIANNLGSPTSSNQAISLGETTSTGTLRYTGTGETTARGLYIRADAGGGGVIEQAGSGALVITGDVSGSSSSVDKTLTLQGSSIGTGELSGALNDSNGTSKTHLVKAGTGSWTLSGVAKAYEGTTTVTGGILNVTTSLTQSTAVNVSGGTFVIGADNVIRDDATVTLGAGAILQMADFSDTAGVLAVTGNAQLQLSGGGNLLSFSDSSSANWTGGTLAISGWTGLDAGDDQILFQNTSGLTTAQLAVITFVNPAGLAPGQYSARLDGIQLVPDTLIPEPSTILAFLASGAGLLTRRRRD